MGRTGKELEEDHWNVPRVYPVPAALVTGRTLTLAVRVFSFRYDGGIGGSNDSTRLSLADGENGDAISLTGQWKYQVEHDFGVGQFSYAPGDYEPNTPHILFDNKIAPLVPYAIRGAIWYQGENDSGNPETYAALQRGLIEDWRWHWGLGDFPFLITQLPNYMSPQQHQPNSNWARMREAQISTADALPAVGVAITIDVGDADDIHPHDKRSVGHRLAQYALAQTYGQSIVASGPVLDCVTREGSTLRCHFRHLGAGLVTTDGLAPRLVFVADSSGMVHPAVTKIEGDTLLVSNPTGSEMVEVFYAWADNPQGCNLANRDGFPASPFRSPVK